MKNNQDSQTYDKIHIRRANISDISEITILWIELMDFHARRDPVFTPTPDASDKGSKYFFDLLKDTETNLLLVAEDMREKSSHIFGYCIAKIRNNAPVFMIDKIGQIDDLYVSESYRQQNIGKKLVNEVIEWFRVKKISRIEVGVTTTNELSQIFWKKIGLKDFRKTVFFTL